MSINIDSWALAQTNAGKIHFWPLHTFITGFIVILNIIPSFIMSEVIIDEPSISSPSLVLR